MKNILVLLFFFISFVNVTHGYLSPTSTVMRNLNNTKPSESSHSSNRVASPTVCSDPAFEKIITISPKLKVSTTRKEVSLDFSSKNIEFLQIIPKDNNHSDIFHDSDIQSICGGVRKYVNKYIYWDFDYQWVDKTLFFYRELWEEIIINDFGIIWESQVIVKLKDSPLVFELNLVDSIPVEQINENKLTLYSSFDLFTNSNDYYSNTIVNSFSINTSSWTFTNKEYSILIPDSFVKENNTFLWSFSLISSFEKDETFTWKISDSQIKDTSTENSLYKTQTNSGNTVYNLVWTQGLRRIDISNAINITPDSLDSLSSIEFLEKRFDMFEEGDYRTNIYSSLPQWVYYLVGKWNVYKLDTTNSVLTYMWVLYLVGIVLLGFIILWVIIFILKIVIDKINKYIEKNDL